MRFERPHSLSKETAIPSLVLVHGLSNVHQWSDEFLSVCLDRFGSGNVFAIVMNESMEIHTRTISGRLVYYCGNNKHFFGGYSHISRQVRFLKKKIELLHSYGLKQKFNIIAHSMGGLVSRRYIHENPSQVLNLVTIATPHLGSPLADSLKWAGFFLRAEEAIADLGPSFLAKFNRKYPITGSPLAEGGRIYTIEGGSTRKSIGWRGEITIGRLTLKKKHGVENDGFVPDGNAKIEGAIHVADFERLDHYKLVRRKEVAIAACDQL